MSYFGIRTEKKSVNVGSRNPAAKLDEIRVSEMRLKRESGMTLPAIAREFGVAVSTVYEACHGRTWKNVRKDG